MNVTQPGTIRWRQVALAGLAVLAGLIAGCNRKPQLPEGRTPPNPSAPARYGSVLETNATQIPRRALPGTRELHWPLSPVAFIETELSPAILVHSTNRYLGLFNGLSRHGLGAPSHVAWSTASGPRAFKNGDSLDVTHIEENWVLVWFAGAPGWTNWDSPWAVFLQHRPASMKLDVEGLHITFSNRADDVVLLPLYGADKLPVRGSPSQPEQPGAPASKMKTWEWAAALPRDPLIRLRFWAGASRRFPLHCEDSFSVNRANDSVTIRSRFQWHSIEDEWNTKPLRLAPLSPTLALAVKESGFPVTFSAKPFDLEMFTPWGPYFGVTDVDSFDATFSVLQYVNETGAETPVSATNQNEAAAVQLAFDSMVQRGGETLGTLSPETVAQAAWLAKALPYVGGPAKSNAVALLRSRLLEHLTSQAAPKAGSVPPDGIFDALWAYAHFTGDWALVRSHWPSIRSWFVLGKNVRWSAFGRLDITENGGLAAPCSAFARLAYQAGDLDAYRYACSLFARDLVQLWAKQRGLDYFRQHQPARSMERMPEEVFLTTLLAAPAGWSMDGPGYPAQADQRRFHRRWTRFSDSDVSRFYQDYLGPNIRRELAWLEKTSGSTQSQPTNPALSPARLRALLLQEAPAGEKFPKADDLGRMLSILRARQSPRFERLIPPGDPSPFVTGPERETSEPNTTLTTILLVSPGPSSPEATLPWPAPGWPEWSTPMSGPWTFGQIKPMRSFFPRRLEIIPLNWNTRLILGDTP